MPIVFVHGVNNREGQEYQDGVAGRDGFLRQIVAPALGLSSAKVHIQNPYWGGAGVSFAWNLAVLPAAGDAYEKFGAGGEEEALGRVMELLPEASASRKDIVEYARQDFAGAIELLYGAALQVCQDDEEANAVASSYLRAVKYVKANPQPDWLHDVDVDTDNFPDVLYQHVRESGESFGGGGSLLDKLKEGASRVSNALPNATSSLLNRLARNKLNASVTRFAGDAFVYLQKRGQPGKPGPIVDIVLKSLHAAVAAKDAQDNKLIVIAHSFGGEIMYDILTRFEPTLSVDFLITVGSQVGLFEEMKCYLASDNSKPPGKVPKPASVKRWLNVFDLNDVFSYRTAPVFEGVEDFQYDSGFSSLQAHGGYFMRPSFYQRLAERIK